MQEIPRLASRRSGSFLSSGCVSVHCSVSVRCVVCIVLACVAAPRGVVVLAVIAGAGVMLADHVSSHIGLIEHL